MHPLLKALLTVQCENYDEIKSVTLSNRLADQIVEYTQGMYKPEEHYRQVYEDPTFIAQLFNIKFYREFPN